jgi:hypothetical protein
MIRSISPEVQMNTKEPPWDSSCAFAVNGGTLTEYADSPATLPAGETAPSGIVVN